MHMQILLQLKSEELKELLELGLNHEQQHQELLLTDIKYILGNNPIFPVYNEDLDWENDTNSETGFIQIEEGIYEIGHNSEDFPLTMNTDTTKYICTNLKFQKLWSPTQNISNL